MVASEEFARRGAKIFWCVTVFSKGGYKNFSGGEVFWHVLRLIKQVKRHKLLEAVFNRERGKESGE